jgi:arylsulfatase A-like enzyme
MSSRSRRAPLAALTLAAALSADACSEAPELREPRLVLVFAPCTVARGFLSPYAPGIDFTPNLERLRRGGVVFRRHMSEAGQSGTAYASILTGAQAPVHGVFAHPTRLADSLELMPEVFARHGYETYFWGGHPLAGRAYNYDQGVPAARSFEVGLRGGDPVFRELLARLRADPTARAFVFTNFTVTHAPYTTRSLEPFLAEFPRHAALRETRLRPLDAYLELYAENVNALSNDFPATVERLGLTEPELRELAGVLELLYRSNVAFLDRWLGGVLDAIESGGLLDESLIAFTTDHGEVLYREGVLFPWTHGIELAPEELEVAWLVRPPAGVRVEASYAGVTRSIDVLPTLAGLAGLAPGPPTSSERGVDLSAAVLGRAPAPALEAFSHTTLVSERWAPNVEHAAQWLKYHGGVSNPKSWVALRAGDAFFRHRVLDTASWGTERFDLSEDPFASRDRFDRFDAEHGRAEARLLEYQAGLERAGSSARVAPATDAEAEARLRALGYLE